MTTLIIASLMALSVSFLCSLMEAAILSLNPGKLARLQKKHPRAGEIIENLKKDIEKPIAVILIINTAAHTFGASIAGGKFGELYGTEKVWIFSLIFTVLMVQYTEILPKTIGVRFNLFILACSAKLLYAASIIFSPLVKLIHLVNRPFEFEEKIDEDAEPETLEELDALAEAALEEDHITPVQEQAIKQIPDLKDDPVTEIMIPENDITWFDTSMSRDEVIAVADRDRHARYPVRDKSGKCIGILELRSILFSPGRDWKTLLRPVTIVPAELTLLPIAENLNVWDSKLILVRDKKSKIIGMLTTNDLLMSIFSPENHD